MYEGKRQCECAPRPTALVRMVMKIKLLATGLGLCLLIPLIQGPENVFIFLTFKIQSFSFKYSCFNHVFNNLFLYLYDPF